MTTKAYLIRVKIELGATDLFYATSPDLKGLLVTDRNLDNLYNLIPETLQYLYSAMGMDIIACGKLDNYQNIDKEYKHAWVAITEK